MIRACKRLLATVLLSLAVYHVALHFVFENTVLLSWLVALLNLVGITAEPTVIGGVDISKTLLAMACIVLVYVHLADISPFKGWPGRIVGLPMAAAIVGVSIVLSGLAIHGGQSTIGLEIWNYTKSILLSLVTAFPFMIYTGAVKVDSSGGGNGGLAEEVLAPMKD